MSTRDEAMARRVAAERARLEEAVHLEGPGGGAVGDVRKFTSDLHPHDRSGKFARTFTQHPKFAHDAPIAGSPGRAPGKIARAGKTAVAARPAKVTPDPNAALPETNSAARAEDAAKSRIEKAAATGRPLAPSQAESPAAGISWPDIPAVKYRTPEGNGEDTQSLHSHDENGRAVYTAERHKLHDKIVAHFMKGVEPAKGEKHVLFMAGGPASGKSSVLALPQTSEIKPSNAVHIDPDEIKAMIPEYQDAVKNGDVRAASLVHEESSDIAKRLLAEAMAKGTHIIRDGTGDSGTDKFAKQIQTMKAAGYKADALYVNAPTEEVLPRAAIRAQRTGRWVPEAEIRRQHAGVSAAFEAHVKGLAENGTLSNLRMYQTTEKGVAPTLFASTSADRLPKGAQASESFGSRLHVHDVGLYNAFLHKAQEDIRPKGNVTEADMTDRERAMSARVKRHLAALPTVEATFTAEEREKLAKAGKAMPDGSYPIRNGGDLDNAVQAIGRAPNKAAVRAHIVKRAKALKLTGKLPDGWVREAAMLDRVEREMIAEAADSMAKATTPQPFSTSKTSNWVAKLGGLPDYIQHVAHGLVRGGKSESQAIGMAIGIVRRWARGGGKIDKNTQAAAALAISQWEKLKAENAAKSAAAKAS